jgi:effector-binding domain-containing protein
MPSAPYEVREVTVAARPVAGVHAQIPRGRVAQQFGGHLDQVYAAARAGAVQLDGQNVFIYRETSADRLIVDFCVGLRAPFTALGAVVPMEAPRGIAAMTTHGGEYGRLDEAHAAILAWCQANDRLLAGSSWEVYGHWHEDPAQLRTDVYYLLQVTSLEARP